VTATDPLSRTRTAVSNTVTGQLTTDTNENGHTTAFEYGVGGQIQKVTTPEGNYVTYGYDSRGNRTSTVATPKAGSGLAAIAAYATYPAGCASALICNKLVTTTDEAGNVTNYYYNADGSLDYVEAPASAPGAARPRTRYGYGSFAAWTKTSSGAFAPSSNPVTLPVKSWACKTTSACADTSSDAVKTTMTYQSGSSAAGSNLRVISSTTGSGTGTPSATVSYGHDNVGNTTSVTDALSHTNQLRFNEARQEIARWSPDPDGAGPRRPRAVTTRYQADGQPDLVTEGTANSDGSGFTGVRAVHIGYDVYGRKITSRLNDASNGAATAASSLTQMGYDALGRVECVAVRMTPSTYGSLPGACAQVSAPGADGPDRIGKTLYNNVGHTDTLKQGVGTLLEQNEAVYTYTVNGQISSVIDAKGNVTAYSYDGYDRPVRTCYDSTIATCTAGSPGDYVELGYGTSGAATGKLISRKLRGNSSAGAIAFSYDLSGRGVGVDYPGLATTDSDVTYSYDLLDQLLSATDSNGHAATVGFDALGNVTSEGDAISTRVLQYDSGGRRSRLTWADGFYVTYEYDATGAMIAIKENGSTVLATFEYDDLGRRTKLTRGNGIVSTYGYNIGSQLNSLALDMPGTINDQTFAYTNSPAAQSRSGRLRTTSMTGTGIIT
jgi:YD repeat-containing protein